MWIAISKERVSDDGIKFHQIISETILYPSLEDAKFSLENSKKEGYIDSDQEVLFLKIGDLCKQ